MESFRQIYALSHVRKQWTENYQSLKIENQCRQAFFFSGSTNLVDLGLLIVQVTRSHSDTPHSVGLLWTDDRPVAETST